jgi:hypothetical protein
MVATSGDLVITNKLTELNDATCKELNCISEIFVKLK